MTTPPSVSTAIRPAALEELRKHAAQRPMLSQLDVLSAIIHGWAKLDRKEQDQAIREIEEEMTRERAA